MKLLNLLLLIGCLSLVFTEHTNEGMSSREEENRLAPENQPSNDDENDDYVEELADVHSVMDNNEDIMDSEDKTKNNPNPWWRRRRRLYWYGKKDALITARDVQDEIEDTPKNSPWWRRRRIYWYGKKDAHGLLRRRRHRRRRHHG